MECSKCLASSEWELYFDVVSSRGVITICKSCLSEENYPVVKRHGDFELRDFERQQSVYERLSKMSGITKKIEVKEDSKDLINKNKQLKEISLKNFKESIKNGSLPVGGLVDKFHWIIMRIRRRKKLTVEQLARAIGEPEMAVRMVERGIISSNNPELISKIEGHLGIRLRKKGGSFPPSVSEQVKESINISSVGSVFVGDKQNGVEMSFDPVTLKNMTISDLNEVKRREEDFLDKDESNRKPLVEEEFEKKDREMEKEMSDDEIDDLIFGRK